MVYPGNPGCLWSQLQASTAISEMLDDKAVCSPSDRSYLEGLAEAYKNSTAWDTRRQILSVMAGIASYKAISLFSPGITPYRYTMANLHRPQFDRAAPVPKKDSPRLRIDRQQLDHFLSFITSLPCGNKNLKVSNGQSIAVPNVIRTLIPQRIVRQYQ